MTTEALPTPSHLADFGKMLANCDNMLDRARARGVRHIAYWNPLRLTIFYVCSLGNCLIWYLKSENTIRNGFHCFLDFLATNVPYDVLMD